MILSGALKGTCYSRKTSLSRVRLILIMSSTSKCSPDAKIVTPNNAPKGRSNHEIIMKYRPRRRKKPKTPKKLPTSLSAMAKMMEAPSWTYEKVESSTAPDNTDALTPGTKESSSNEST
mmetsp:Transcript_30260/g.66545  ORF Transcript_30260/g.66545 Transcript_30260/m.66545 type:complete len:119 (-) Transcript_30260:126-482(-)